MASTIRIKRSSVAGKVPNTSNISTGELALNLADKRIYSSNGSSTFELGSNPDSLSVGSGGFTIANGSISFPNSDGSSGQVLQTDGSGTLSFTNVSGGAASNTFSTINIAGQSDIVAEASGDTLTFVAGAGVTLTSNNAADSVTIATTVQDDTVAMAIALG